MCAPVVRVRRKVARSADACGVGSPRRKPDTMKPVRRDSRQPRDGTGKRLPLSAHRLFSAWGSRRLIRHCGDSECAQLQRGGPPLSFDGQAVSTGSRCVKGIGKSSEDVDEFRRSG